MGDGRGGGLLSSGPGSGAAPPANRPSKVLQLANVPANATEADLIDSVSQFGMINYVHLTGRGTAYVEFETLKSAEAAVTYNTTTDLFVLQTPVYTAFADIDMIPRAGFESERPGCVLVLNVNNPKYPITVDVIAAITKPIAEASKLIVLKKRSMDPMAPVVVLAEFVDTESARLVKQRLNGCDIYSGCCTLKIEYAKITRLNVTKNDQDQWDYVGGGMDRHNPSGYGRHILSTLLAEGRTRYVHQIIFSGAEGEIDQLEEDRCDAVSRPIEIHSPQAPATLGRPFPTETARHRHPPRQQAALLPIGYGQRAASVTTPLIQSSNQTRRRPNDGKLRRGSTFPPRRKQSGRATNKQLLEEVLGLSQSQQQAPASYSAQIKVAAPEGNQLGPLRKAVNRSIKLKKQRTDPSQPRVEANRVVEQLEKGLPAIRKSAAQALPAEEDLKPLPKPLTAFEEFMAEAERQQAREAAARLNAQLKTELAGKTPKDTTTGTESGQELAPDHPKRVVEQLEKGLPTIKEQKSAAEALPAEEDLNSTTLRELRTGGSEGQAGQSQKLNCFVCKGPHETERCEKAVFLVLDEC